MADGSSTNTRLRASKPTAAVVGAGLAGLAAAFRLQQLGWNVQVFESSDRCGGRVQSVAKSGYLFDTGATALAKSYTVYFSLLKELGLNGEVVPSSPYMGIYRSGEIHLLNLDRIVLSMLTTRIVSTRSKLKLTRLLADIVSAKRRGQLDYSDMRRAGPIDNESAMGYARRVLNDEIEAYLASPVIRSMLIAGTDQASKVELFSGIANIFTAKLFSLKGGLARTISVLVEATKPHLNCEVTRVAEHPGHAELDVVRTSGASETLRFDTCVVCCPLPIARKICTDKQELLQPLDSALSYTQAITVGVGTRKVPRTPASLVQVPACEDPAVALLFLDHNKAPDRAPPGHGLINCHWESRASSEMLSASDEDIVARTLRTVYRVFPEIEGSAEVAHVARWPFALPLTGVGIYKKIGNFTASIDSASRIQFAADYMGSAGQNSVTALANRAAHALHSHHAAVTSGVH